MPVKRMSSGKAYFFQTLGCTHVEALFWLSECNEGQAGCGAQWCGPQSEIPRQTQGTVSPAKAHPTALSQVSGQTEGTARQCGGHGAGPRSSLEAAHTNKDQEQ